MTLLLTPVLERIAALEAERARILWRDYLTPPERARLKEIAEALPALWEARRRELTVRPDPKTLAEAIEYDARKSTEKPRPPRLKGRPQYKPVTSPCPVCHGTASVVRCGHYVSGRQRYICRACNTRYGNDLKAA